MSETSSLEAQTLAAAALTNSVASLMEQLVDAAASPKREIAAAMGVTPARVSQLLGGDGNVRISSLGRLAHACGAHLRLKAVARGNGKAITVPRPPRTRGDRDHQAPEDVRQVAPCGWIDTAPDYEAPTAEPLLMSPVAWEQPSADASMAAAALSNSVGSLLERVAGESGLTRSEIATRIGVSPGRVTQILDGDGNVRIATLARVLEATGYDLSLTSTIRDTGREITVPRTSTRRLRRPSGVYEKDWVSPTSRPPMGPTRAERKSRLRLITPLSELVERGHVPAEPLEAQEQAVCTLLNIATPWDNVPFSAAARRHNPDEPVTAAQRTWLACAREAARGRTTAPYDRGNLRDLAAKLTVTLQDPDRFTQLPTMFATVGVRLVYVAPFKRSKISGVSFLLDDKPEQPVIALSGRGKRMDKTLFTLLHEAAHVVLNHPQPGAFVIDEDEKSVEPQEMAADELASTWALPSPLMDPPVRIDEAWVLNEAERHRVHPAVIVGRLQHSELLTWRTPLVHLIPNIEAQLDSWHRV